MVYTICEGNPFGVSTCIGDQILNNHNRVFDGSVMSVYEGANT